MFIFFIFLILSISNNCSFFFFKKLDLNKIFNKRVFYFFLENFDYKRDKKDLKKIMIQNSKHLWSEPQYLILGEKAKSERNEYIVEEQIEIYKDLLKYTENNKILVKRENNKTVGYIFYKYEEKFLSFLYKYSYKGSIEALAVEKEFYGKKYGEELLNFAINDLLKNENINHIEVLTTNKEVGLKFYLKYGFFLKNTSYNQNYGFTYRWKKYLKKKLFKIKFKKIFFTKS